MTDRLEAARYAQGCLEITADCHRTETKLSVQLRKLADDMEDDAIELEKAYWTKTQRVANGNAVA